MALCIVWFTVTQCFVWWMSSLVSPNGPPSLLKAALKDHVQVDESETHLSTSVRDLGLVTDDNLGSRYNLHTAFNINTFVRL